MEIKNKSPKDGTNKVSVNMRVLKASARKYIHTDTNEELYTNVVPEEI
jgi:hypothetical protein